MVSIVQKKRMGTDFRKFFSQCVDPVAFKINVWFKKKVGNSLIQTSVMMK